MESRCECCHRLSFPSVLPATGAERATILLSIKLSIYYTKCSFLLSSCVACSRCGGRHEKLWTVLPRREGSGIVLRALDSAHPAGPRAGRIAFRAAAARHPTGIAHIAHPEAEATG